MKKKSYGRRLLSSKSGLTFIEIMVTLAFLSVGIVMIFRTFLISLNQMEYVTQRLYATNVLDNRIVSIKRNLKAYHALPFDADALEPVQVASKSIKFDQQMKISEYEGFSEIFNLRLGLSWQQGKRNIFIERELLISDFSNEGN